MKNTALIFIVSLFSGIVTLGAYKFFFEARTTAANIVTNAPTYQTKNVGLTAEAIDFTEAAESALNQVVHVKNVSYRTVYNPIDFFYGHRGGQQQQQIGTGSGVIISEDGYIVTNNHVINEAQDIEITLNNKKPIKQNL
jgi:S1-C subfamily serine protease